MFRLLKHTTFESSRELLKFVNSNGKIVVSIVKNSDSLSLFYYEP